MKKDITELFTFVDDFFKCADKFIQSQCLPNQKLRTPTRTPELSMSEIMTIILLFQHSPCKNFKYFYKGYLPLYAEEFPRLCSYNRFIELQPRTLPYLTLLLLLLRNTNQSRLFLWVFNQVITKAFCPLL